MHDFFLSSMQSLKELNLFTLLVNLRFIVGDVRFCLGDYVTC